MISFLWRWSNGFTPGLKGVALCLVVVLLVDFAGSVPPARKATETEGRERGG